MNNMPFVFLATMLCISTASLASTESHESQVRDMLVSINAVDTAREPIVAGLLEHKKAHPQQSGLVDCIEAHITDELLMDSLTQAYMKHTSEHEAYVLREIFGSPGMRKVSSSKTDSERNTALSKISDEEQRALKANYDLVNRLGGSEISKDLEEIGMSIAPRLAKQYCGHFMSK